MLILTIMFLTSYFDDREVMKQESSSGKKREVGYLRETNCFILFSTNNGKKKTSIIVTYETKTHSETTIIPKEDIQARKLIKYFFLNILSALYIA